MNENQSSCPNCGANHAANEIICQYCGTKLKPEIPSASTPAPASSNIYFQTNKQKTTANKGCVWAFIAVLIFIGIMLIYGIVAFFTAMKSVELETVSQNQIFDDLEDILSWSFDESSQTEAAVSSTVSSQAPSSRAAASSRAVSSQASSFRPQSSKAAEKTVSIALPKAQITTKYTISFTGTTISETIINSIKWEKVDNWFIDGEKDVRVKLTFECKKISDYQGEQAANSIGFRAVIKNSTGEIVETKNLFKTTVSVNQLCTLDCDLILTAGGSYTVEITDYIS